MTDAEKKKYEPPRLLELDLDLEQAAGQTACTSGRSASGPCTSGGGPRALPGHCRAGRNAQRHCRSGNLAGFQCRRGGVPLG